MVRESLWGGGVGWGPKGGKKPALGRAKGKMGRAEEEPKQRFHWQKEFGVEGKPGDQCGWRGWG